MEQRGGHREGAGRPKGSSNLATKMCKAKLAELARAYTENALSTLADVMMNGRSDSARVAAANALLDRGYGRAKEIIETHSTHPPTRIELVGKPIPNQH